MINKIMTFKRSYEVELRAQVDDKGEVWFVTKDVCDMLGVEWQGSKSLECLDEDEKRVGNYPTHGGNQELINNK